MGIIDGLTESNTMDHTQSDLDSQAQAQDGSDYEFDIHGLPRPNPHEPLLPTPHHHGGGSLWYRHPVNIGLLCVASSVLLMVIVSGLYAWSRWKHSRCSPRDKRIEIDSEDTPLLLSLQSERTEDAFDLDEHEPSSTPNQLTNGLQRSEGMIPHCRFQDFHGLNPSNPFHPFHGQWSADIGYISD